MGCFVFVHGGNMSVKTWNELANSHISTPDGLMGGRVWDPVMQYLPSENVSFAPTLGDEKSHNLTDHINQICDLIIWHDLNAVRLVAHSYGGMVISGVAARMPERIHHLVYVDAAFPDPGQSLYDIIRRGGCDPSSFQGLEPEPPYIERLTYDMDVLSSFPKVYIVCTSSSFSPVTEVVLKKIQESTHEWTIFTLHSSHVPMASMPEKLASILLETEKIVLKKE